MKSLFFFLFISLTSLSIAQNTKYSIVLFGNTIGNGVAQVAKLADGQTSYKLKTEAKAKVFFKERTSMTDIDLRFKGNVLHSCVLKRENDGEYQDIKITLENGKYYFTENGKRQAVSKAINFTTTQLFFKEPVGVKEVYVERLNIFAEIVEEEKGLYKTIIDGGDNYYRYENGVLVEFRLKKGVNVYMYRV
ncbi:MAG: DUF6134 family protein [Chitinophagales bacterium]